MNDSSVQALALLRAALPSSAVAALFLALAAPSTAQIVDRTRVTEVLVPVQVVDRGGDAVRGLGREDFQILDGGKKREIKGFQTIDLDLVDPAAVVHRGPEAIPAAGRRHFVLVFDMTFSRPASIVKARLAAREFVLADLHPADLVAVATHSAERGARTLMTFTTDRGHAMRAIDAVGSADLVAGERRDPLGLLLDPASRPTTDPTGIGPDGSSPLAGGSGRGPGEDDLSYWVLDQEQRKSQQRVSEGKVASWAASLAEFAGRLDSLKGRKQIVYFSEGFDGELLFGREQSSIDTGADDQARNQLMQRHWSTHTDDRFGNSGLLGKVDAMLLALRQADCVLHAVDISGLVARGGNARGRQARQHALFYLSSATDGELLDNASQIREELGRVLERSAVTYLLTFDAADVPADGAYHPLKVRASLPQGGRLAVRSGYFAPRPYRELHPMEKSLLASQAIAAATQVDDVGMNLIVAPFRASAEGSYVPVVVEVPGAGLIEEHEGARLPVELYVYVTDESGEIRDFLTQLISLDLASGRDRFAAAGVKFYGHLDLAPGTYLVRVLVRNGATGRFGLQTRELAVPAFDRGRPYVLPPFFVESGARWVLVREKEEGAGSSVVYPFTVDGRPFIPAAKPALVAGDEVEVCLVAYNLGPETPALDALIVDAEGAIIEGAEPLVTVTRTMTGIEGLDKLTATFRPGELEPGEYELQVSLTDAASGWTEVGRAPFVLEAGRIGS